MTIDDPSEALLQGPEAWAKWRERNPGSASFNRPRWYDCPGPGGVQLKGTNRVDFSGMDLSGIEVYSAFAEGLQARNAVIDGAHFEEGDFSRADFSGSTFRNTKFNKTILTGANFEGASFINCNLNRVNLVGANFRVEEIRETVVYGIAAWDLQTSDTSRQSRLVIEKSYELYSDLIERGVVPMMVDDIELAQFIYYLSNHRKIRDTLNILNDRGVLLLGRFPDGGLERLYRMREWFQGQGYMAMIFDFERPTNLSLTETVITMAGLSKFVVADLSGRSVPAELHTLFGKIHKPILALGDPYAMFPDLADSSRIVSIDSERVEMNLMRELEDSIPRLEALHAERIETLAKRYTKADSARLGTD